ncbi:hypothetical protein Pedsa_0710 [Pseudopedobacter saltans DSM 12145]|uniref:DUF4886 domain-containing protein n=1 Tax=Pseudopedobacter saltans (strain ATCC 51119 / DSM 12145 / JCM 21818 / CCUG 39354 / LMG 10337 / NBRC 100064 / NCIMB 13643) TaxID=762903 RepID=F0S8K2_PSESL|nr:DUF4886 domain-containing protein [Pseudopedobacter saltans]ADY51286.1 hypothetical protein Pedsa_0710 [Pseudopedobacter saltans DSM 12145]
MKHYKSYILSLLCFTIGILCIIYTVKAEDEKGKELRLLVIGNSFSRNATLYLPQLAAEGGHKLVMQKAEISGSPLKMHWDAVEIAEVNPDDPKGKPYNGKSLKMLLMNGGWDIITMQQASTHSAYPESYYPYINNLYNFIKKFQPAAEIVIHQTWSYREDASYFSRISEEERANSAQEMWEKSRMAYHKVAKEFNLRIIPTGDAFWQVSSDSKWKFIPDANFNFKNAVYPELPKEKNSLNVGYSWTKNKKLKLDANHANQAGCYLGALIWYSFLFRESPFNLKFVPENVSQDFAEHLRETASKTVLNKN